MTANQIAYQANLEKARSNQANEAISRGNLEETARANRAKEKETYRSNVAKESETYRANRAKEDETHRSNIAQETETHRHNYVNEWHDRRMEGVTGQGNIIKGLAAAAKLFA